MFFGDVTAHDTASQNQRKGFSCRGEGIEGEKEKRETGEGGHNHRLRHVISPTPRNKTYFTGTALPYSVLAIIYLAIIIYEKNGESVLYYLSTVSKAIWSRKI